MRLIRLRYTKWYQLLSRGIFKDNPIYAMALGICSALAVTNRVENAIAMGLGVTFVLMASSMSTSLIRKFIPAKVRMVTYMVLISTFVIAFQGFLQAYFFDLSKALGAYTGLIITNCIVMGRAEAFAIKNPIHFSALDALANGLGYMFTLIAISVVREVLAFGTLLGIQVVGDGFVTWTVMAMAPGAFFVMAIYMWIMRTIAKLDTTSAS
ncbi:MAG: NADH:ubiquinone reductase (Na(+)-transporting) subunit D [Firmicutes bacterium HGW-Firmicutes-2]|jgi:Na+-transporting NADH:ubiquinone oxidoreductase subunit D|nr:MAG: NADH:ubiquinone reductase (Na(+)-transporting) subunit D [Firmicutes bacterium HGW-Firmicutes-2]